MPRGKSHLAALGILLILAILAAVAGPACTKNETENTDRSTGDSDSSGDDSDEPDYNYCLEAFDFMTSSCGAQFYSESGVLLSQNDLVKSCARPRAACAVECYRSFQNCDALTSCLESTCGLK